MAAYPDFASMLPQASMPEINIDAKFDPSTKTMIPLRPTTVSERRAKRRAQNRESQKAFRRRKAEQEENMIAEQCKLQARCNELSEENEHLRELLSKFRNGSVGQGEVGDRPSRTASASPRSQPDESPECHATGLTRPKASRDVCFYSSEATSGTSASETAKDTPSHSSTAPTTPDGEMGDSLGKAAATTASFNPSFFKDLLATSQDNALGLQNVGSRTGYTPSANISITANERTGLTPYGMPLMDPSALDWSLQSSAMFGDDGISGASPFSQVQQWMPEAVSPSSWGSEVRDVPMDEVFKLPCQDSRRASAVQPQTVADRRGVQLPRLSLPTLKC